MEPGNRARQREPYAELREPDRDTNPKLNIPLATHIEPRRCTNQHLLVACWMPSAHLAHAGRIPDASWQHIGRILSTLGASWAHAGRILGTLEAPFGDRWPHHERCNGGGWALQRRPAGFCRLLAPPGRKMQFRVDQTAIRRGGAGHPPGRGRGGAGHPPAIRRERVCVNGARGIV